MKNCFDTVRRGRLSREERARVEHFANRGLKAGQIALRLNRHPSTINWQMHNMGLRTPVERRFSYLRNGREVRSFSGEEDALITGLRQRGLTLVAIAGELSDRFGHRRTHNTVRTRLIMIANREATT